MLYYIILFFTILLIESSRYNKDGTISKTRNRIASFVFFILLLAFYGLRNKSMGPDTEGYVERFINGTSSISIAELIDNNERVEPLFQLLCILLRKVTTNYSIYLTVCALPFCIGVALLFKEESKNFFISLILLITLDHFVFCFSGLRQSMSLGLCLIAYVLLKKNKYISFLIFVLVSFGFHNSAPVFLLLLPLKFLKTRWSYFIIVAIFFVVGYTKNPIIRKLGDLLTGDAYYSYYFAIEDIQLNYTVFILQSALILFSFLYKNEVCKKDKNANLLYNLCLLGLCFQALINTISILFRVSLYFSMFLPVLVTKAIACENNEKIRIAETIMLSVVILFYLFVLRGMEYVPFWIRG